MYHLDTTRVQYNVGPCLYLFVLAHEARAVLTFDGFIIKMFQEQIGTHFFPIDVRDIPGVTDVFECFQCFHKTLDVAQHLFLRPAPTSVFDFSFLGGHNVIVQPRQQTHHLQITCMFERTNKNKDQQTRTNKQKKNSISPPVVTYGVNDGIATL